MRFYVDLKKEVFDDRAAVIKRFHYGTPCRTLMSHAGRILHTKLQRTIAGGLRRYFVVPELHTFLFLGFTEASVMFNYEHCVHTIAWDEAPLRPTMCCFLRVCTVHHFPSAFLAITGPPSAGI